MTRNPCSFFFFCFVFGIPEISRTCSEIFLDISWWFPAFSPGNGFEHAVNMVAPSHRRVRTEPPDRLRRTRKS